MMDSREMFDFDAAGAEVAAATTPLIAKRDGMIRRVNNEIAEHLAANRGGGYSTEQNADLDAAYRRYNQQIRAAAEKGYARHADALQVADVEEGRAFIEQAHEFLAALDRRARFEEGRGRFQSACGVPRTPTIVRGDLSFEIENLIVQVERAIAPQPAPRPQGPPLHERLRALIGV